MTTGRRVYLYLAITAAALAMVVYFVVTDSFTNDNNRSSRVSALPQDEVVLQKGDLNSQRELAVSRELVSPHDSQSESRIVISNKKRVDPSVARRQILDQSTENLDWIVRSQYWNPREIQLSSAEINRLRGIIELGRQQIQAFSMRETELKSGELERAIAAGKVVAQVGEVSVPPGEHNGVNGIAKCEGEKTWIMNFPKTDYPHIWDVHSAFDSATSTLQQGVLDFFAEKATDTGKK